jgi:hypothetical protein
VLAIGLSFMRRAGCRFGVDEAAVACLRSLFTTWCSEGL